MSRRNIHLLALLLAALLVPLSAPCADEPQKSEPTGTLSPEARTLIEKAVQAAGGKTNLLGCFTFKDNVRLGATDKGLGAKRESVMDAPRHWWLKAAGGYSERDDEPATFLVWAWTLGALTSPASTIEIVPDVKDGGLELWGLRVSGSVKPAMDLYFSKTNDLLARPCVAPCAQGVADPPWFTRHLVGMEVGPTGAQFGHSDSNDVRYAAQFDDRELDSTDNWVRFGKRTFSTETGRTQRTPPSVSSKTLRSELRSPLCATPS